MKMNLMEKIQTVRWMTHLNMQSSKSGGCLWTPSIYHSATDLISLHNHYTTSKPEYGFIYFITSRMTMAMMLTQRTTAPMHHASVVNTGAKHDGYDTTKRTWCVILQQPLWPHQPGWAWRWWLWGWKWAHQWQGLDPLVHQSHHVVHFLAHTQTHFYYQKLLSSHSVV